MDTTSREVDHRLLQHERVRRRTVSISTSNLSCSRHINAPPKGSLPSFHCHLSYKGCKLALTLSSYPVGMLCPDVNDPERRFIYNKFIAAQDIATQATTDIRDCWELHEDAPDDTAQCSSRGLVHWLRTLPSRVWWRNQLRRWHKDLEYRVCLSHKIDSFT